jgi:hypothetical protein
MAIPRSIKLKDTVYQIRLNPYLVYYGICDIEEKHIQLAPKSLKTNDVLHLTLIHEIVHALLAEHGITAKSEEVEEAFVCEVERNIKRFFTAKE